MDCVRYTACFRCDFIEHLKQVGRFFFFTRARAIFSLLLQMQIRQVLIFCVLDIIAYLKVCASVKMLRAQFLKFFVLSLVLSSTEPHAPIFMKLIFHTFPLPPLSNIYSITNIILLLLQIISI